jgi:hypothetical protein
LTDTAISTQLFPEPAALASEFNSVLASVVIAAALHFSTVIVHPSYCPKAFGSLIQLHDFAGFPSQGTFGGVTSKYLAPVVTTPSPHVRVPGVNGAAMS